MLYQIVKSFQEVVSEIMDVEDPIEDAYFLEVSSPGLNRGLFTEDHYKNSIGKEVLIIFTKPLDEKTNVIGILKEVTEDSLIVVANEEDNRRVKNKGKSKSES